MADGRAKNGGPRPNSGRKKKIVEDASQSILFQIFDAQAERDAVLAMIEQATAGNVAAFKELMDRKYGKVKEQVEHSGNVGFIVDIGGNDSSSDPTTEDLTP